jgi:transcriptional regulator with XRE-family HTH domain
MLRLTLERKRRGWSQRQLAQRADIGEATISRLEAGKVYPYPGWKKRLSRVLRVPGDELFQEVSDDDKPGAGA